MPITKTNYNFTGQTQVYHGKVRDVYTIGDTYLVSIATDRISAFDVILPKPIPFKGQVLNKTAVYFLNHTKHIVSNWLIDSPHPNVSIGYRCQPLKVEMVVRGYLAGHAWREYKAGKRQISGVQMSENMQENQAFPSPIITPSTKADVGHDEDISKAEILQQGLVDAEIYAQLEAISLQLFAEGTKIADQRNLILVDTKYEFGLHNGKIMLIDEIHTPDSSRYFFKDRYQAHLMQNKPQQQFSKEFVREWLISQNFMGKKGQKVPDMPKDIIDQATKRYKTVFETLTDSQFVENRDLYNKNAIFEAVESSLKQL